MFGFIRKWFKKESADPSPMERRFALSNRGSISEPCRHNWESATCTVCRILQRMENDSTLRSLSETVQS